MKPEELESLRAEFEQFVRNECAINPEEGQNSQGQGDAADTEPAPAFVDDLQDRLLSPAKSGVYLSRLDIKRIAEAIDESLPVKERKKMLKALFRHTTSKAYLRSAFDEISRHLEGRMMIYRELSQAFPASASIFEGWCVKIEKIRKMFDQIVEDFEEIEPTSDPMMI